MFFFIIAFCVFSYAGGILYTQLNGIKNGEKAPSFELVTINNTVFDLKDFKGKYVLLDFWGSWCPPCLHELPDLVALHNEYPSLIIVSIALEKSGERWKNIALKHGMNWEYQVVEYNKLVMMSSIARAYGVTEIPAKFLITPEGEILSELDFIDIQNIISKKD